MLTRLTQQKSIEHMPGEKQLNSFDNEHTQDLGKCYEANECYEILLITL